MRRYHILLLGLWFLTGGLLYSQNPLADQKISLSIQQRTIESSLQELGEVAGVSFSYNPERLPIDSVVSVTIRRKTLSQALDLLLGAERYVYQTVGQYIILQRNPNPRTVVSPPISTTRSADPSESPVSVTRQPTNPEPTNPEPENREPENKEPEIRVKPVRKTIGGASLQPPIEDLFLVRLMINEEVLAVPTESGSLERTRGQFTFISPVGTNWLESGKKENVFSFNLLAGYAGGLRGVELGGLLNVVRYDVYGVQLGGLANVVGGKTQGVQFAGLTNINRGAVTGVQMSGLVNWADTLQVGLQGSGFLNVLTRKLQGAQVAGFGNLSLGEFEGAQISGFTNVAREVNGFQIAPVINVAGAVKGGQVSGFLNVARSIKGVQVGVFNFADTLQGVPIGLFSFVKNGYHRLVLSGSESMPLAVHFKSGGNRLYNIVSLGARWGNQAEWGFGYGLGTQIPLWGRQRLQVEWTTWQVQEVARPITDLNLLNVLHLGWNGAMGRRVRFQVGPTYNIQVSQWLTDNRDFVSSMAAGRQLGNSILGDKTRFQSWAGLQISFAL